MKKISLVGLLVLLSFSFAYSASAETSSQNAEGSTYETESAENTSETSDDLGIGSASSTEASTTITTESSEVVIQSSEEAGTSTPTVPALIELSHLDSPSAAYVKGEVPKAEDFKAALEQVLKLSLRTLSFQEGSDQTTSSLDLHTTKIFAIDNDGKGYVITCTYIVKSDIPTLNAPTLNYDAQTNMVIGITFPYAAVYFYEVGLENGQPLQVVHADANGNFSISGEHFERGRLMSVVVYTVGGVEFSEPVTFKIPLEDTPTSGGSNISSETQETATTSSTDQAQKASQKSFPSTGETNNVVLAQSGFFASLAAVSFIVMKRKKQKHS